MKKLLCIYADKSSTACSTVRGCLTRKSKKFQQEWRTTFSGLKGSNIATFGFTLDKIFSVDEPAFSTAQTVHRDNGTYRKTSGILASGD
jgi:hypothetical protein